MAVKVAEKPVSKAAANPAQGAVQVVPKNDAVIPWNTVPETGFENVTAADLGIPFLTIIQKGSAEFDETHQKHKEKRIEGVKPGDVINIITRQIVYKSGGSPLIVVPVHWDKFYMEWKPRTAAGGGIVRAHKDEALLATCRRNEKNLDVLPNGNLLVTTAYFHLVTLNAERNAIEGRVMIGMSSTQLRKSRTWLNAAQSIKVHLPDGKVITPPLFSHAYAISTGPENNDKGSWFGWVIKCDGMITDVALAEELVECHRQARADGAEQVTKAEAANDADVV